MNIWALIAFGILALLAIAFSVVAFLSDAQQFLAPDIADEAEIKRKLGADTPAARRAMAKRFGGSRSWLKDGLTGLSGLFGLISLYWLWFG